MKKNLKAYLNILFDELKKAGSPLENIMQKGLSEEYMRLKMKEVSLRLPPEVYTLYSWHNGVETDFLESKALGECGYLH